MEVVLSCPGLAISSRSRLCFTSTKLARRCNIGHRSVINPKRVSTPDMAGDSRWLRRSLVVGARMVPDIGDVPKESAEEISKYLKAYVQISLRSWAETSIDCILVPRKCLLGHAGPSAPALSTTHLSDDCSKL